MESNIKKNLRKPFLKELKPEEILKVKNLVSEKRLYLQLGKEVGPELATKNYLHTIKTLLQQFR